MMKVIDAHIHPFIDQTNNIAVYGSPGSLDEFIAELKRAGITHACGSVIQRNEAATFDDIIRLNRAALEIQRRYPNFYIPGVHVHSRYPEESCRELEQLYALGVRWIGELVPYLMETGTYAEPGLRDVFALAQDLGMPVNLHLWPSPMSELETLVADFPRLKVVLAHPGDHGEAVERFTTTAKYENLFMDVSGTGLFRWNMLRYAIDLCGSEKLLFGSDFPICSPGMNLHGVLAEHLSETELVNVLYQNFERLTGLASINLNERV